MKPSQENALTGAEISVLLTGKTVTKSQRYERSI